jgi:Replication initiation factor
MLASSSAVCLAPDSVPKGGLNKIPLHSQSSPLFEIRLDTLTYTRQRCDSLPEVEDILNRLVHVVGQDEILFHHNRPLMVADGKYTEHSAYSLRGVRCGWTFATESEQGFIYIHFPGKFLSQLNIYEQLDINCTLITQYQFRGTRVDIALDDFSKTLAREQLQAAISSHSYTHYRTVSENTTYENDQVSWSFRFGSPKSEQFVVIYDKEKESKGRVNSVRIEARFRAGRASDLSTTIAEVFAYNVEAALPALRDICLGALDFVDRDKGDKNLDRCPRSDWWQSFLDKVSSTPLRLPKPKQTRSLAKTRQWLDQQVQTSLAMVVEVFGFEYLHKLVAEGKKRYTDYHQAQIRNAKAIFRIPVLA